MITIIKTISITLKNSTGNLTLNDLTGWQHALLDEILYEQKSEYNNKDLDLNDLESILNIADHMNDKHDVFLPPVELSQFLLKMYHKGDLFKIYDSDGVWTLLDMYIDGEVIK